jgi:hypothetical protein
VGDGTDDTTSLDERALGLGLVDILEWRGFRSDLASELGGRSESLRRPAVPEPFVVVVGGIAAGLPMTATSIGGRPR